MRVILTEHARRRWHERFAQGDDTRGLAEAVAAAVEPDTQTIRWLQQRCRIYGDRVLVNVAYDAAFVVRRCNGEWLVVTVLVLSGPRTHEYVQVPMSRRHKASWCGARRPKGPGSPKSPKGR